MKKIVLILLSVLLLTSLFLVPPVSAKSYEDLKTTHQNMSQYIYKPYFENSPSYPAFQTALEELGQFLEGTGQTEAQIDFHYAKIRNIYAQMMLETFDYTALIHEKEAFDRLDASLFTQESWQTLSNAAKTVADQLSAPSLFIRYETTTFEIYQEAVHNLVMKISNDFTSAYNNLEVKLPESNITRQQHASFVYYIKSSAPQAVMGSAPSWAEFKAKLEQQEDLLTWQNPAQWRWNNGVRELFDLYQKVAGETFDFSAAQSEIAIFESLNKTQFTSDSYLRYQTEVSNLKLNCTKIPQLYFSPALSEDEMIQIAENYTNSLIGASYSARNHLITMEKYDTLFQLCQYYRGISAKEGLEVKWEKLNDAIQKGFEVLSDSNALPNDLDQSLIEIQSAADDYELALHFYTPPEKTGNENVMMKNVLLYSAAALIASLLFGILISYRTYGRFNFTK